LQTARPITNKPTARNSSPAPKPTRWNVAKTTGGCTFVEKWGAKGLLERFTFRFDDGEAERLAKLLNRLDKPKPIAKKTAA
jgi:hypothetical protein